MRQIVIETACDFKTYEAHDFHLDDSDNLCLTDVSGKVLVCIRSHVWEVVKFLN